MSYIGAKPAEQILSSADIQDGAISTVDLANGCVTAAKIASGQILPASGIVFPATQSASADANTLDDYEEGTWTPAISPQNGSLTAYTSSGSYTKIGNTVYVIGTFTVTTTGTSSGYVVINGYPFTSAATFKTEGVAREGASSGDFYGTLVQENSNAGFILGLSGNGAINWTNGRRYDWNFTYRV